MGDLKNETKKYTLEDLQKLVDEQVKKRGGYWGPKDIVLQISAESGELSDAILKVFGPKPKKETDKIDIEIELVDLLYAIICYANSQGINISEILLRKIDINEKRDKKRFKRR